MSAHQRQVGDVGVDRGAAAGGLGRGRGLLPHPIRLAAYEHNLGTPASELDGRGATNPARRSGDHHDRH